jgi:ubiquinone/menaquinone biosynthesis C-methylase UbiE
MHRVGASDWNKFIQSGKSISASLNKTIEEHFGKFRNDLKVLDFGCGCGRVLINLSASKDAIFSGVDVDKSAISYLENILPDVKLAKTQFNPPLPFANEQFDCVYSISIWSHLAFEDQSKWLLEIKRIVKNDGLILISTQGYTFLNRRRENQDKMFKDVKDSQLQKEGIIFRSYSPKMDRKKWCPGVKGNYGSALHCPQWIKSEWGKFLYIKDIKIKEIDNTQDLVVMVKKY